MRCQRTPINTKRKPFTTMEEVLSYSNMMSKNSDKYQKKAIHNETVDCCAFKGCQRTPINTKRKPFGIFCKDTKIF